MSESLAKFSHNIWHSPMLMTWAGTTARLSGLLILLPLVMTIFSVEETALWFLFSTILSLQALVDFGFSATFVRFVAYSNSSGISDDGKNGKLLRDHVPKYATSTVVGNMRYIYARLSVVWLLFLGILGSLAVARAVASIETPAIGWLSWVIITVSSGLCFRGGMHVSYLRGMEYVALHQRWEIVMGLGTTGLGCAVLLGGGGLLELVITNQFGGLLRYYIYRHLAEKRAPVHAWKKSDKAMFDTLWAAVWRSGLGVLASFGTIQMAGVFYAQVASPKELASYLLAVQLIQRARIFAYVPFSSRIPDMSRMYANGDHLLLLELSGKAIQLSTLVFLASALIIGFSGDYLLEFVGSNTPFVAAGVWWLLALAYLFELNGAMHIQLYSTSNHIVWHIVAGVSGLLMLIIMPVTFSLYGIIGLPMGICIAYAIFYMPYSMFLSYRAFAIPVGAKKMASTVLPILILLVLAALSAQVTGE